MLIKSFNPSDFVPTDFVGTTDSGATSEKIEDTSDQVITADFQGASFVFTGKLSTMTRKESQQKVTAANGKKASGVTAKLDYLVIGDEGSPFYGAGRKGSKQLKAESLVEKGAGIRIISETAFLQMLSGKTLEVSEDALVAGCTRLWNMLVSSGPADDPLRQFALTYLRMHHPDICLEETDRPVDPGAEIPLSFLTFAQVEPLFADNRRPLRDFGLELARWEFAGWMPSSDALLRLCELPHPEVRAFVAKSLLSDDTPEHRRYRLSQDMLTSDMVYDLCESADPETRNLGMELISRNKRLQLPDLLFPLTESPDNKVRGFVIHTLWSFYRERGVTPGWKPTARVQAAIGKKAAKKAVEVLEQQGQGVPDRPEKPPAGYLQLDNLFRRVLFEIPPGRPEKTDQTSGHDSSQSTDSISGQADEKTHKTRGFKLRHLPARKAKLSLIETIRDLAVKDGEFADVITPLLEEFMGSRGKSEQAACLVAVTRIRHAH